MHPAWKRPSADTIGLVAFATLNRKQKFASAISTGSSLAPPRVTAFSPSHSHTSVHHCHFSCQVSFGTREDTPTQPSLCHTRSTRHQSVAHQLLQIMHTPKSLSVSGHSFCNMASHCTAGCCCCNLSCHLCIRSCKLCWSQLEPPTCYFPMLPRVVSHLYRCPSSCHDVVQLLLSHR